MKLTIENFGPIKKPVLIEPKSLTLFCGANNTGKTYALYVLNALMDSRFTANFDFAKAHAKVLYQDKHVTLNLNDVTGAVALQHAEKNLVQGLKDMLPRFFVAENALTDDAKFSIALDPITSVAPASITVQGRTGADSIDQSVIHYRVIDDNQITFSITGSWVSTSQVEQALNRLLMPLYLPQRVGRDFLLPAERSGLNLFFRELNSRRAALLRHVTSQTLDTAELLKDIIISRYPQPIHDYIEFMNSQPEIKREVSEFADLATWLQKEVLKVKYKVDRYGDISVAPLRSGATVGLHLGSSTVKTFFGLWSYLNHLARKGDWFMIDEPELNLHPQNQRIIARLLAELVNRGIRVVVSTHSDYMVREWGNLIMLGSQEFEGRDALAQQYGLVKPQWLTANQVSACEFDNGGAKNMLVTAESGIKTDLFDASIQSLNAAAQDIYFARQAVFNDDTDESEVQISKPRQKKKSTK